MSKKEINALEYATEIATKIPKGVLLTTKLDDKVNSMTIGWGTIGVEWGRPIFIVFVREKRFTYSLIEKNPFFTINVPYGKDGDPRIISFLGTKSGRDYDKIKEMNLTLEEPNKINVPGLKEFPLTLECKVIYKSRQYKKDIPSVILDRFYPSNPTESDPDEHIMYIGEIVDSYIIE